MIAVLNNQKSVVEFLSLHECGIADNDGKTALIHSVLNNKPEFIQCLQKEVENRDKNGKTALIHACETKNSSCIA